MALHHVEGIREEHKTGAQNGFNTFMRFVPGSLPDHFDAVFVGDPANGTFAKMLCRDADLMPLLEASPLLQERYCLDPTGITVTQEEVAESLTAGCVLTASLRAAAYECCSTMTWGMFLEMAGVIILFSAASTAVPASVPSADHSRLQVLYLLYTALLACALKADTISERCLRQISLECPEGVLLSSSADVGAALALLPASAQGSLALFLANSPTGKLVLQQQALKLGLHDSPPRCDDDHCDRQDECDQHRSSFDVKERFVCQALDSSITSQETGLGVRLPDRMGRLREMRRQRAQVQVNGGKENVDRRQLQAATSHFNLATIGKQTHEKNAKQELPRPGKEGLSEVSASTQKDAPLTPTCICSHKGLAGQVSSGTVRVQEQKNTTPKWGINVGLDDCSISKPCIRRARQINTENAEDVAQKDVHQKQENYQNMFTGNEDAFNQPSTQCDTMLSHTSIRSLKSWHAEPQSKHLADLNGWDVSTCSPQDVSTLSPQNASACTSSSTLYSPSAKSLHDHADRADQGCLHINAEQVGSPISNCKASKAPSSEVSTSIQNTPHSSVIPFSPSNQCSESPEESQNSTTEISGSPATPAPTVRPGSYQKRFTQATDIWSTSIDTCNTLRRFLQSLEEEAITPEKLAANEELKCSSRFLQGISTEVQNESMSDAKVTAVAKEVTSKEVSLCDSVTPPTSHAPESSAHSAQDDSATGIRSIPHVLSLKGRNVQGREKNAEPQVLTAQRKRSSSAPSAAAAVAMLKAKRRAAEHQRKMCLVSQLEDTVKHMVKFKRRDERLHKFVMQQAGCLSPVPNNNEEKCNSKKVEEMSVGENEEPELTFRPLPPRPHPEPCQ
eukprot:gnl/MRDRNA2_/MRDRNA2_103239_c0_seq1.p1 gnl/MRDRNA2_/MRDRNA2_103239_c0~~gnl/MRDRNA2_/MRDRNA2_103239_c0_seq1.p1  ORF type:complete len:847 (-),score=128.22 gnl/MRDRNA2_/MRDRNA2_103239_c0_seq1:14-2554(-)